MSKLNYHEQTFSLDALDLDPIEKNIIRGTLNGLYGMANHPLYRRKPRAALLLPGRLNR
nr:MAG TPA: Protein of unknown function (DUF4021) [Caudoviricetes sp.]